MNKLNISAFLLTSALLLGFPTLSYADSSTTKESAGQFLDDTTITTKIKAALLSEPSMSTFEVNVETFKGTVQLSGFVTSKAAKDRADEIAKSTSGVKDVINNIILK
jgi:osmotically-inducible protein OsmY